MPRSLARLRYKLPPAPVAFVGQSGRLVSDTILEQRAAAYVDRQSNPHNVRLQVVVNPKTKIPTPGKAIVAPRKPFTLRDIVDPDGKARHGESIYVFRNIKTNQIIYSLGELLNDHHLAQLPFIGKHSKPPVLRPDEWTPHCVVTFPSPEQGHSAYRKLREFRKKHEYLWPHTNPKWKIHPVKQRIKLIMDQRANTTADIAAVLRSQDIYGQKTMEAHEERQKEENEYMDKKWAEIDALANAAKLKENVADNTKWLEHQIRSLTFNLKMKHNQNEADQKRLKNAKTIQEIRLRKIQYAQRKAEQFKTLQETLAKQAEPAKEYGAEGKLDELRNQADALRQSIKNPDPLRTTGDLAVDENLLAMKEGEIAALEQAFEAKAQSENRDHYIARSILPKQLKKALPTPFSLDGVSVRWADLRDALYAAGKWPESIEHEELVINKARNEAAMFSVDDYNAERRKEVNQIMQTIRQSQTEVATA